MAAFRRRSSVASTSTPWEAEVAQQAGLDTSPLPRITGVAISMGLLVSMGEFTFFFLFADLKS